MGLHIEFIRVCLGKTPHFPKHPPPVICILIVYAFTSRSATAQLSDWSIMTLMTPVIPLFLLFPHPLSRLSITFLIPFSLCAYRLILCFPSSSAFSLPSLTSLPIPSLLEPDEYTGMKLCDWHTERSHIVCMRYKSQELYRADITRLPESGNSGLCNYTILHILQLPTCNSMQLLSLIQYFFSKNVVQRHSIEKKKFKCIRYIICEMALLHKAVGVLMFLILQGSWKLKVVFLHIYIYDKLLLKHGNANCTVKYLAFKLILSTFLFHYILSSHAYIFEAINFNQYPAYLNWICFTHPGHPAVEIITTIFTLQRGGGQLCNTYHSFKGKYAWWQESCMTPALQKWNSSIKITVSQEKEGCEWIYVFLKFYVNMANYSKSVYFRHWKHTFCKTDIWRDFSEKNRDTTEEEEHSVSHYLTSSSYLL